ncbi:MAG: DUF3091 domain-containing protein [Prevotella sp.]|nr:DUF3091 domain-containing protein [Prevotella sp.]
MQFEEFIKAIGDATPLVSLGDSLDEISKTLGHTCRNLREARDFVSDRITDILYCSDGVHKSSINLIIRNLYCLQYCKGQDFSLYIKSFDTLNSILSADKTIKPFEDEVWQEAFVWIRTLQAIQNKDSLFFLHEKEIAYADKFRLLRKYGLAFHFEGMELVLEGVDDVARVLYARMREIGGRRFLKIMFGKMSYFEDVHRFVIPRSGNTPHIGNHEIDKPYSYMYHLGMRCIKNEPDEKGDASALYSEIEELCTAFCFLLHPVQEFNKWADIIPKAKRPEIYLRDLLFKESVYGLQQANPVFMSEFCHYLIERFKSEYGHLAELLETFSYIMDWFEGQAAEKDFSKVYVSRFKTGIRRRVLSDLLPLLEHNQNKLNDSYLLPSNYQFVNDTDRPLVRSKNLWLLPPKSIMAIGWYEALTTLLRKNIKGSDNLIGKMMEDFIQLKFDKNGIRTCSGKYYKDNQGRDNIGECDHVVEADKTIIFIEDKKKPLTRLAKEGNTDNVIFDIAHSLVDSQYQCFRTSRLLMDYDHLVLQSADNAYDLRYSDRNIERISVDLFDFGPISDRMLAKEVLSLFCKISLGIKDNSESAEKRTELQKEVKRVNDKIGKLCEEMEKLYPHHEKKMLGMLRKKAEEEKRVFDEKQAKENAKGCFSPFFNSWFLTLEQLVFLIEKSKDGNSFEENLKKIKYVTTCTYEFYNEWHILARPLR